MHRMIEPNSISLIKTEEAFKRKKLLVRVVFVVDAASIHCILAIEQLEVRGDENTVLLKGH